MQCKYCSKQLAEGSHGKRAYCNDAHKQAYYREKSQRELQDELEILQEEGLAQQQEIEQLTLQMKDQQGQIEQLETVIFHLKQQMNLEQRYLNDTQARGFVAFLRRRHPPTPLIEKFLADRSLFDRGGRWYYETRVRFVYKCPEEEILEFKDLWKVLILESSRDDF